MRSVKFLWVILLLAGCASRQDSPDLGGIYDEAARQENVERNPVIVIPGLLGSKLVDGQGRVVWGEFGGNAVDLGSAEGMRALALPMDGGRDDVRADGALQKVKVSLGLDFKFEAYSSMLQAFGVGGYTDEGHAGKLPVDYGPGHYTCFQFGYDWRKSSADNAVKLGRFIEEKRKYVAAERLRRHGSRAPVKFDIVTHSMGGLVARYYMMFGGRSLEGGDMAVTWAGAKHVSKVIMVGTPNDGSVYPLQQLREGFKLAAFVPKIPPAVIATMPGLYELLPTPDLDALIDKDSNPLPAFSEATWERFQWGLADPKQGEVLKTLLPDVPSQAEQRRIAIRYLAETLRDAKAFRRAISQKGNPPAGTTFHAFVGDSESTASRAQVGDDGKPILIDYVAGDGVVTRRSALADRRSKSRAGHRLNGPVPWRDVNFIFTDHVAMTSDPAFTDNVLHLLLERP